MALGSRITATCIRSLSTDSDGPLAAKFDAPKIFIVATSLAQLPDIRKNCPLLSLSHGRHTFVRKRHEFGTIRYILGQYGPRHGPFTHPFCRKAAVHQSVDTEEQSEILQLYFLPERDRDFGQIGSRSSWDCQPSRSWGAAQELGYPLANKAKRKRTIRQAEPEKSFMIDTRGVDKTCLQVTLYSSRHGLGSAEFDVSQKMVV
ncbi:hypothetical protein AX14_004662 [Amanita brunnescens Koide BX004]|nr:hypothetical protein AX14_004662 [Amanita brunnescens Koide BX004]